MLLSFLPLKRLWHVPSFLIQTIRITRQLEGSSGVMGYSLNARPFTGHLGAVSAWENEAALQALRARRTASHASVGRFGR